MKRTELPYYLLAAAVCAIAFFCQLGTIPIRIWDEARLANSALDMKLHGLSLVPRYDGAPDLWSTKPPLMIWLQAICLKIFGSNETAIRLPSALASFLTGLFVLRNGARYLGSLTAGLLASLVFATSFGYIYIHAGRTGDYDALLSLFIFIYCFAILRWSGDQRDRWIYAAGAALIGAALTKGVAGLLFLPGLLIWLVASKQLRALLKRRSLYLSLLAFVLIVGGYYFLRERINPGYLKAVWDNELGGRYLATLENHNHPFSYYAGQLFTERYCFWAPFLIPSILLGIFSRRDAYRRLTIFNLAMTIPYLLIISSGKTKLGWYDVPLYPFFALQIGLALHAAWLALQPAFREGGHPMLRRAIGPVLAIALLATPAVECWNYVMHFEEASWDVDAHKQGYFIQERLRRGEDLNFFVFAYQGYDAQIKFYTQAQSAKGSWVQLQNHLNNLNIGQHLVVSQEALRQEAEQRHYKKIYEVFGCTEYIVSQ